MINLFFGPVLIPDLAIYRRPNLVIHQEHFVTFDRDTIRVIREKFHRNKFDDKVTIEHNGDLIGGIRLISSFILENDNRKFIPENLQDLPNGTWMVGYLVENPIIQQMIEKEEIRGFSVEGIFPYGEEICD